MAEGALEFWGLIVFIAACIAMMGLILGRTLAGEDVGSVDSGRIPRGLPGARSLNLRVRRVSGGRRWTKVRLVCRGGAVAYAQELDRREGLRFAELLEGAARAAGHPVERERGMGAVGLITVGVLPSGPGPGWVTLSWILHDQATAQEWTRWSTCLRSAGALRLAELLRIACQPGERLADAKRSWWRELDRRRREAPPPR